MFPLIEKVNANREAIEIVAKSGSAVLLAADDYRELQETAYLLRSPANVRRLLSSLEQAQQGKAVERQLDRS